jgi:phage tail-like protein
MASTSYPPVSFHFQVRIDKGDQSIDTSWQEVSGLSAELTTESLVSGGENSFVYELPVGTKYPHLVLKRGSPISRGSSLIQWVLNALLHFKFERCNVVVSLLDGEHAPIMTWNFKDAYPVKWSFSDMKSIDNAIMIETLELVHQGSAETFGK